MQPSWSQTHDLPAFLSGVLRLQVYATHFQPNCLSQFLGIYSQRNLLHSLI